MELVIIRGYPGSGKSTVGKKVSRELDAAFIDHNALLNVITDSTDDDEGLYEAILGFEAQMTEKVLRDRRSVVVARGFVQKDQVAPFLALGRKHGAHTTIVRLDVPATILESRVSRDARTGYALSIKDGATLRRWVRQHPMQPVLEEHAVDASETTGKVVRSIIKLTTKP